MIIPDRHPAFVEARRLRAGVHALRDNDPTLHDAARAMIDLTGDHDGMIAASLLELAIDPTPWMEALVIAFVAGMICERDRH